MMKKRIVVLGSANIDHIAKVKHIPVPGETVGDGVYSKAFGGKGFNQAVAATKASGDVTFLTSVGDDDDGRQIINTIRNDGANTDYVLYKKGSRTGAAFIFVEESGENSIVVSPGANKELTCGEIDSYSELIAQADFLVMQIEIPIECVEAAADIAHKNNTFLLLNPAPACKLSGDLISKVDLLVVNETESEIITGIPFDSAGKDRMAAELIKMGARSVIITLGDKGAFYNNGKDSEEFSAFKVNAVDTTAAGDTFCGSLIAFLADNMSVSESITMACAASALSVQKLGAYPSIPGKEEINAFIIDRG
ncbi:MAG TPA: ribokinase [Bacteroidetes bacterium]|nr:ribokinase [Bacteroidota bacterium]